MTTTRRVRVVECFAGAGGLSRAWELGGAQVVAHLEIDDAARSVLRAQWPGVRLLGDVAALAHGRRTRRWWRDAVGPVDVVSGGSPCQDLSVAGARAGLDGARSSLFFEQVRLWRMLGAPYFLWENVAGAFSSRRGADFAVVLSALVGGAVAAPRRGWRPAGVVAGPRGVAAWRCTDLHRYGVPQRRRRIVVLAARAGGVDPAEVLALDDGVLGDPPARGGAWEDTPAGVDGGARGGEWAEGALGRVTHALRASDGGVGEDGCGRGVPVMAAVYPAVGFNWQNGGGYGGANPGLAITEEGVGAIGVSQVPAVVPPAPLVIASGQANAERAENVATTLTTLHEAPIVIAGTIGAHAAAPGLNGQDAAQFASALHRAGVTPPRRLTPRECERLMSWPDDWTRWGVDARGRRLELKDTPRYKLCGNGVATVQFAWVCERLTQMELATP
jgi:DNA (cytosine-5)-methyltransferase 1